MLDKVHRKNTDKDYGTSTGKFDLEPITLKRPNSTSLREQEKVMCNKRCFLNKEVETRKKVRFSLPPSKDIDGNEGKALLTQHLILSGLPPSTQVK